MHLKKRTLLLGALLSGLLLLSGCASKSERAAKEAVKEDLERLQSSDSQTIQDTIDTRKLLPSSQDTAGTAEEIGDIFSLFYKDFSFQITQIETDEEKGTGRAGVKLTTLDARSLAKDYSASLLKKQIELEASPKEVDFSLRDSCLLLRELLEKGNYGTKNHKTELSLKETDGHWEVLHTQELDEELTGNFASYMTDSRLLSPSEIVEIHLDTIKAFDKEQMNRYLSLDQLVDTDDSYSRSLAAAISGQIEAVLDYEILGEKEQDSQAQVQVSITSPDFAGILDAYQEQVAQWSKTSDSLSSGAQGRREKERELLLSSIEENTAVNTEEITIHLYNDGINWKIQMDPDISDAVLGNIPSAMDSISQDLE